MQLESLGKHWPHRKMEWVMSGVAASWGLYVCLNPVMFDAPVSRDLYSGLRSMTPAGIMPHVFWGLAALIVGLLRALALYINGAHVRTPAVRVVGAFATMFVFSQIGIGLWQTGIANAEIIIYSWLVAADMISAYSAGKDAVTAEVHRRIVQGTINDDSRINRALARL